MIQRVNQAFADGKLSARHAYQMKADIRAVASDEPNQEFSDEQSRQIAGRLNELNIALDKDLHGPSSVAASPDAIPK